MEASGGLLEESKTEPKIKKLRKKDQKGKKTVMSVRNRRKGGFPRQENGKGRLPFPS